jgi:hypothetical protein
MRFRLQSPWRVTRQRAVPIVEGDMFGICCAILCESASCAATLSTHAVCAIRMNPRVRSEPSLLMRASGHYSDQTVALPNLALH